MAARSLPLFVAGLAGALGGAPKDAAVCGSAGVVCHEEDAALLQVVAKPKTDDVPEPEEPVGRTSSGGERTASLASQMLGIEPFKKYPGYKGKYEVSGRMWIRVYGNSGSPTARQSFTYKLEGVDEKCGKGRSPVPHSCCVEIHEGLTCDEDTGKPFWNSEVLHKDPWGVAGYTSYQDDLGISAGTQGLEVMTAYSGQDIMGKTVVVHDFFGHAIACAKITTKGHGWDMTRQSLAAVGVSKLENLRPFAKVTGTLTLNEKPGPSVSATGSFLSLKLKNVDKKCCNGPNKIPLSCGIRLRTASVCRGEDLGMVHFNAQNLANDPWAPTAYTAVENGDTVETEMSMVPINHGLTMEETMERIMVVYDYMGQPLACGVLNPGAQR